MTPFQIVALPIIACLLAATLLAVWRGWAARHEGIVWVMVWMAAAVAILRPELTQTVARALGIGRGKDLVLYCAVLGMLVGFLMVYVRIRELRQDITLLVRQLAIQGAVRCSDDTNLAPSGDTPASKDAS